MNKLRTIIFVIFLFILLAGCGPSTDVVETSTDVVEKSVKNSMQTTFNSSGDYKEYHLKVSNVQVVKDHENHYQGVANVLYKDESHSIPITVTADDKNVIWHTEPGAFLFIAQQEVRDLQETLTASQDHSLPADKWIGTFPFIVVKDPSISSKFKYLLDSSFSQFEENISGPSSGVVALKGDYYFGAACKAHSCGDEQAAFTINKLDKTIFVAIRSYQKVVTFGDDKSEGALAIIDEWIKSTE